jgi:hypothetical protein
MFPLSYDSTSPLAISSQVAFCLLAQNYGSGRPDDRLPRLCPGRWLTFRWLDRDIHQCRGYVRAYKLSSGPYGVARPTPLLPKVLKEVKRLSFWSDRRSLSLPASLTQRRDCARRVVTTAFLRAGRLPSVRRQIDGQHTLSRPRRSLNAYLASPCRRMVKLTTCSARTGSTRSMRS